MRITLTARTGKTIAFEVQDKDIIRFANGIVNQIDAFESPRHQDPNHADTKESA